jgi:hypothetical protein
MIVKERALGALASMVRQYLEKRPDILLDSYAMPVNVQLMHSCNRPDETR